MAPKTLRPLITICSGLNTSNPSDKISILSRRIISGCINGGLALNLLQDLREFVDFESVSEQLKFEPNFIRDDSLVDEKELIKSKLSIPIMHIKRHLFWNSLEAQFRTAFWDPVLTTLLEYKINESDRRLDCLFVSEWKSKSLFPSLESRRVDLAVVWSGIPVMIVEIGYGEFGLGVDAHKDFSKLISVMSHSCKKLAMKLEADGKGAENANVFGIWIGGTQIHFITAKAIITETESNNLIFHCNCFFPPEWKLNVIETEIAGTQIDNDLREQAVSESQPASSDSESGSSVNENEEDEEDEDEVKTPVTPVNQIVTSADSETASETEFLGKDKMELAAADDIDLGSEEEYEKAIQEEEEIVERSERNGLILQDDSALNINTLVSLDRFIGHVVNYVEFISEPPSSPQTPRRFQDPETVGFFPASRRGPKITPGNLQVKVGKRLFGQFKAADNSKRTRSGASYDDNFHLSEGKSVKEVMIFCTVLAGNSVLFPRLVEYFSNEKDEELFDILFEKMDPLLEKSGYSSFLSEHLWYETSAEALLKALKFTVELLNSLDMLHSIFGLVHSRICPENVMFSLESNVWKLIDYEYSMPISAALNFKISPLNLDKTTEYISPESLESGIFTEASDVFSLGKVIHDVLYHRLLDKFETRSRKNDLKYLLYCKFGTILFKMIAKNPKERISVQDALRQFYKILSKFRNHFDPNHPAYSRIELICTSESLENEMKRFKISDSSDNLINSENANANVSSTFENMNEKLKTSISIKVLE
ncbi:hypothetical protein C9890_0397 [Perkinsus sp. BL_2016]|nr:hypothetical protein C9890_0397 [Perkinsus sp. BL_2016]